MKNLLNSLFVASIFIFACKSSKVTVASPVELISLTNYFPKINLPLADTFNHFVIRDSTAFDNQFGMAKTADNILVTPNFGSQTVLAIQGKPTTTKTIILFDRAEINQKDLSVYYTATTAETLSFTMTPAAIATIPRGLDIKYVNFFRNKVKVFTIQL